MKKIMFKKSGFILLAIIAGTTIMMSSSCSKNNNGDSALPSDQGGQMTTANDNPSVVNSFTITAADGHLIGVNGVKPIIMPDKGNANAPTGCSSASNLKVAAVSGIYLSNGTYGCILSNNWVGGGGACIALFINGVAYKDPTSGYSLWLASTNGIAAECRAIPGGIPAGKTFTNFVRTYCGTDTTISAHYDSPVVTYVVPSNFNSACGTTSGTTKGGGKRK